MRLRYIAACVVHFVSFTSFSYASISFGPDFDGDYVIQNLGTPSGLVLLAGGITLLADKPNKLLIGGSANTGSGAIYSVDLNRDHDGHITGFAGPATVYASAPYIDGGLAYGPGGVLFYTRYNTHQLGQIEPGSMTTDRVDNLTGFGNVGQNSVGSLTFVPDGFAGEGQLKAITFLGAQFGTIPLTSDGNGTYAPGTGELKATLSGGPEGIAYVEGGNSGFASDSLLVAEYSNGMVGTYTLDIFGDPIPSTRRDFITGLNGAEGAFVDPLTGDFLFSTFAFNRAEVFVVQGFAPPGGDVPEATSVAIWLGLVVTGTAIRRRRVEMRAQ